MLTDTAIGTWLQGTSDAYQLARPLGAGGFGITHVAVRRSDGVEVVVKQLRMERVDNWKAVELFEREASVMRGLDHPNIPRHLDDFSLGDAGAPTGYALVQSLVHGRTLEELRRSGGLNPEQQLNWFLRLLEVCAFLHRRQPPLVHRDINPRNVILQPDGEPVLIDFGLVQAKAASSMGGSTSAGTFGYAPMEQFVGRSVPSSDLYGLAMTFIASVTGREPETLPFVSNRCDVRAALQGVAIDARLLLALEAMTEPDAGRREVTAEGLLHRLAHLRGAGGDESSVPMDSEAAATTAFSPEQIAALESLHDPQRGATPAHAPPTSGSAAADNDIVGHWRGVRERTLRLGDRYIPAPISLEDMRRSVDRIAVSQDGTRAVVSEDGAHALDLRTMQVRPLITDNDQAVAISADGQCIVTLDCDGDGMHVFRVSPSGEISHRELTHDRVELYEGSQLVMSPDQRILAVVQDELILMLDIDSGHIVERLPVESVDTVVFSPDGRYLIALGSSTEDGRVFGPGGTTHPFPARSVAFSPDGRTMALYAGDYLAPPIVELGPFDSLAPLSWAPRQVPLSESPIDVMTAAHMTIIVAPLAMAFSPDGRRLAVASATVKSEKLGAEELEWEDIYCLLRTFDVATGAQRDRLDGLGLQQVHGLAFVSDGDRLLIQGEWTESIPSSASDSRSTEFWICSLAQRRRLGSLWMASLDSDVARSSAPAGWPCERYTLVGSTTDHVFGRLSVPAPLDETARLPFERPDLIKDLLRGVPLTQLVENAHERDALEDLSERIAFFRTMFHDGELDPKQDVRALVEASGGLTYLLPHLVESARASSAAARFSAQDVTHRLSVSAFVREAATLRSRGQDERDVLFADSLSGIVARAKARAAARQQAAAAAVKASAPQRTAGPQPQLLIVMALFGVVALVVLTVLFVLL